MVKNIFLWFFLTPLWIFIQFFLFIILLGEQISSLVFSLISLILYLVFLLIFTSRYHHSPRWFEEYKAQQQPDSPRTSYDPLTEQDILSGWWITQKKGLRGFLRRLPHPGKFNPEIVQQSILVEVESEAEYYQTSNAERSLPFSSASSLAFFPENEPFPVDYPKTFIDITQEFPLQSTLKKETCSSCSGSGEVSCSSCHGSGSVTCTSCSGRGYTERTEWDGDESKTVRDSCSCFSGEVTCTRCSGWRKETCSRCNGEGKVGKYIVRLYEFFHWKLVHVFKEMNKRVVEDVELKDLPNEDARLIEILGKDSFSDTDPENIPKIDKETISMLMNKKEEFQQLINKLENVLFDRHTFREFPELVITISTKDGKNLFTLVGRGFKPFKETNSVLFQYPLSKLRLLMTYIPYSLILLLVFIFSSL